MRLHGTRLAAIAYGRGLGNALWDVAGAAPSLDQRFAESKSLIDAVSGQNLITFTRASDGTYVDSDGLIKTAGTNVPRFDHDPVTGECLGLLVEEQRTNLLLQSDDFSTTWTLDTGNPTVSINAALSPDGTTTADKLVEGITNGGQDVVQVVSIPSAGQYTYSVYAKSAERFKILLRESTFTGAAALYDLNTGSVVASGGGGTPIPSASIQSLANGWYRCHITMNQGSAGNRSFRIFVVDDAEITLTGSFANRTGDGTSGIYLWRAQVEAGAFPTSPIPTTTSAVTRSADVASIEGANFSSWYRQDEETVFGEFGVIGHTGATQPALQFNNGTDTTRAMLIRRGDTKAGFNVVSSGTTSCDLDSGVIFAVGSTGKTASAYKIDDFAVTANGSSVVADTNGSIPTNDRLNIGSRIAGTYLNGVIRRVCFWPQRLPDTTLQAITQ
jgi:hypothetical protein